MQHVGQVRRSVGFKGSKVERIAIVSQACAAPDKILDGQPRTPCMPCFSDSRHFHHRYAVQLGKAGTLIALGLLPSWCMVPQTSIQE
jgi:hypothetical protein